MDCSNNREDVMDEIKVQGKKRRVRWFEQVRVLDELGNIKAIVRKAGYMFVKNEPKTIFTYEI